LRRGSGSGAEKSALVRLAALVAATLAGAGEARARTGAASRGAVSVGFTRYDALDAERWAGRVELHPTPLGDDLEPYALRPFVERVPGVRLEVGCGPGEENVFLAAVTGFPGGTSLCASFGAAGGESAAGADCSELRAGLRYYPGYAPFAAELEAVFAREAAEDTRTLTAGMHAVASSPGWESTAEVVLAFRSRQFESRRDEGMLAQVLIFPARSLGLGFGFSTDAAEEFRAGCRYDSHRGATASLWAGTDAILGDWVAVELGCRF
jgi:hypothetical protein